MNAFLTKPVEPKVLIRTVREQVERYRLKTVSTRARKEYIEEKPQEKDIPAPFDTDKALENLSGMAFLYHEIAESFLKDLPNTEANLYSALDANDWHTASKQCHSYKGMFNQLGGFEIAALFAQLEQNLREAGKVDDANAIKAQVSVKLQTASEKLRHVLIQLAE